MAAAEAIDALRSHQSQDKFRSALEPDPDGIGHLAAVRHLVHCRTPCMIEMGTSCRYLPS